MNMSSPQIDTRKFSELLKQAEALAPFYTPEWRAGQTQDPGQTLLRIFLHLQEQVLARLNQAPDKNFVAFLDMLGIKLLSAQPAEAAVTFTLTRGATQPVLAPKKTLLSGKAADGSGEVIFQTKEDLLVVPAALKQVLSFNVSQDKLVRHTKDDEENDLQPFSLFDGTNQQERSLYIGHEELFNQETPSEIKINFTLSKFSNGSEKLALVWEYSDGVRWLPFARFPRQATTTTGTASSQTGKNKVDEDQTDLFAKSGEMILIKGQTGEIAQTKVNDIKNRWIRCRLTEKLNTQSSVILPEINTIRLSVNPIDPFAPELAFNNDIPLKLEEISVKMLALEGVPMEFEIFPKRGEKKIYVKVNLGELELFEGDFLKLDNRYDGAEIREIVKIEGDNGDEITLNEVLGFDYDVTATLSLFTALRPPQKTLQSPPSQTVNVESLEGFEVIKNSKVTLFHRGKKEAADLTDISNDKSELILSRPNADVNIFYIEGDRIKITPKIKPFGDFPQQFDTFYIASDEAFSKRGAKIKLTIELEVNTPGADDPQIPAKKDLDPVLSWEYWNGKSWRGIRVVDTTGNFLNEGPGEIRFTGPEDIEKIDVNGEEKFWIRARLIDGNYGTPIIIEGETFYGVKTRQGFVHFPILTDLKISYENIQEIPQHCLTLNNLTFEDRTKECQEKNKVFKPFEIVEEQFPGLFLGFNERLASGPLRILFKLTEQFLSADARLKMLWFYWDGLKWEQLNVNDGTEHLTKIGLLEFVGSDDFKRRKLFDKDLFWLKGSIVQGEHPDPVHIESIHPNSTSSFQANLAPEEIVGSGNGTANQAFTLQHPLVISQQVWVKEPLLTEEEKQAIRADKGEEAVEEKKSETGEVLEILALWREVADFDASDKNSRDYIINKSEGKITFGNGLQGMVPPAGVDNIMATYTYGGGRKGNVDAAAISGLKSAIPFVKGVMNHLPADGGSEIETLENVLVRGPLRLKHRGRAVAPEDFEALAKGISGKVARAKCLPNIDESRDRTPGWVTVMIVPDSKEDKPKPTKLLTKSVEDGLKEVCANIVSAPDQIHVTGPDYAEVRIEATIFPESLEDAASVENKSLQKLSQYFHPLTGGPGSRGWDFGDEVCVSDLFALLEAVPKVDYVEKIQVWLNGEEQTGNFRLDVFTLPFSGDHNIKIKFGSNGDLVHCRSRSTCAEEPDLTFFSS